MKLDVQLTLATCLVAGLVSAAAANYSGNGMIYGTNGAFTGAVGGGMLTLTDDGTTVSGTFTRGPDNSSIGGGNGQFNNNLVLFIDSVGGGFSSTSGFQDAGDGSRKAISGFNSSSQFSIINFAPGFLPDYGISLRAVSGSSFGGLWQLANGGNNSMPFIQNVGLSPLNTVTAPTYTFSFSLASIGLTPGAGQSFTLLGTFVSNTGNRSGEALAGNLLADTTTLKGWVPFTQTALATYTTTAVPEPSIFALAGLSLLPLLQRHRCKDC